MSESYITSAEFYKTINNLRNELHEQEVNLSNRMTRLEVQFNDELSKKIHNKETREHRVSTILGALAGAGASLLIWLVQVIR